MSGDITVKLNIQLTCDFCGAVENVEALAPLKKEKVLNGTISIIDTTYVWIQDWFSVRNNYYDSTICKGCRKDDEGFTLSVRDILK